MNAVRGSMLLLLATGWALSAPPSARAQTSGSGSDTVLVTPGQERVDASRIGPYEVVWVQEFVTEDARTLRRTIVDRVERESSGESDRLVRTQTFLGLEGQATSERVNRVDGTTLEPLRERWNFGGRVTHVDYEGTRVSGAMLAGTDAEPAILFDEELSRSGFDFNVVPLLLSAVELEPGVALRFPHVRISPPAFAVPEIAWAVLHVEGREEVDAGPLGRVTAWRAVDREHDMVFWMMEEAPYLVRVEFPIDDATRSIMKLSVVQSPQGPARPPTTPEFRQVETVVPDQGDMPRIGPGASSALGTARRQDWFH